MRKPFQTYLVLVLWLVIIFPFYSLAQVIEYHLEIDEKNWKSFHVRISIENVTQDQVELIMPKWRPGAYLEINSYKFIENLRAFGESTTELPITQLDENIWSIEAKQSSIVRIEYDVDHSGPRFMTSYVSRKYAIVDGAMNFLYVKGKKNVPININLRVPHGWKVASALPNGQSSFDFVANNYDELIDSPILFSNFREYYFTLDKQPFYVILNGRANFDINNFLVMIKRIVNYQGAFFDGFPFNKYMFLVHVIPESPGGGGLEHSNSSLIMLGEKFLQENPRKAANIIAHEFFHTWNIKRIYPEVYASYDYTIPERTRNLWFCEGVTSYYADLTLIRTNIWSERDFLDNQARLIKKHRENPDRTETTLEEASLKIWERGYNHPGISFYDKGQLVALLLDLSIRYNTHNSRSLDDVMRFMNNWFAKHNEGYKENDVLRAVNSISGHNYSDFFNKYISGTIDLPYEEYLKYGGIDAYIRHELDIFKLSEDDNKIIAINDSNSFAKAGLQIGDEIQLLNDFIVSGQDSMNQILKNIEPGQEVEIKYKRFNEEKRIKAILEPTGQIVVDLNYNPAPDSLQLMIRTSMLGGGIY